MHSDAINQEVSLSMLFQSVVKVTQFERAFLWKEGDFVAALGSGKHQFFDPLRRLNADIVKTTDAELVHPKIDVILASGAIANDVLVVELKDRQRGLLSIDGRFTQVLAPGRYVFWKSPRKVEVEVVTLEGPLFQHANLATILKTAGTAATIDVATVEPGFLGLLFVNGRFETSLNPGGYAFWKGVEMAKVRMVDLREQLSDLSGQEIMTSDRVTLRLNALMTYRVTDGLRAATVTADYAQAIYREAQLALRALIGVHDLDGLLAAKERIGSELLTALRARAAELGLEVLSFGIRDVILPGEIRELMNKVTEAKKAAEASLITRREETASIRSQANTAKIFEDNPTLMRLRELETLEKVAAKGNLKIIVGEGGIADRLMKLV